MTEQAHPRAAARFVLLLASLTASCTDGPRADQQTPITRADVLAAVEEGCSTRPGKGVSHVEEAEDWAEQWPLHLRNYAYGKCFVTLLERFPLDTKETPGDRRINRLSEQIRRLTARIVDRSLNAEGPAEEIEALMEKRDRLEKRRRRLLAE